MIFFKKHIIKIEMFILVALLAIAALYRISVKIFIESIMNDTWLLEDNFMQNLWSNLYWPQISSILDYYEVESIAGIASNIFFYTFLFSVPLIGLSLRREQKSYIALHLALFLFAIVHLLDFISALNLVMM